MVEVGHEPANIGLTMSSGFPVDINEKFFGSLRVLPEEDGSERMYENLETDERVLLEIRRHWSKLIAPLLGGLLLVLVPPFSIGFFNALGWVDDSVAYIFIITWFWYTFTLYYFFALFLRWSSNTWLITNERIIDLNANTISYKNSRDYDLSTVMNVTNQHGGGLFLGGINRGHVTVRVVDGFEIVMENIPMPNTVALVIGELVEQVNAKNQVAAVEPETPK